MVQSAGFCGGFVGLHRFYVRSALGLVYIPLFIILLLFNVQVRKAVNVVSGANNEVSIAEFDLERAQKEIDKGKEGAQQKMDKAKQAMVTAQQNLAEGEANHDSWFLYNCIEESKVVALFQYLDSKSNKS